jgi:drug/metabolite transporter (DMT)-like permease
VTPPPASSSPSPSNIPSGAVAGTRSALAGPIARRSDEENAVLAASVAVLVWGVGPLLVRGVETSSASVIFWRLVLAQPVMIGFAYLTGGRLSWPILKVAFWPGVLFGTSLAAGFASIKNTSIANASLIGALQPALFLVVAPMLFGTRTSLRQAGFGAVSLAGIAAVIVGAGATSGASWQGDALAVVNLVIWSAYFVRVKQIRNRGVHSSSFIAAVLLVACVTTAPVMLLISDDVMSIGPKGLLLMSLMALGPGLVGHGLMTWSQRHLDIRVASLLGLASPVVSTMGAWLVYQQRLSGVQLVGGVLVLVGLAGVVWDHRISRGETIDTPVS